MNGNGRPVRLMNLASPQAVEKLLKPWREQVESLQAEVAELKRQRRSALIALAGVVEMHGGDDRVLKIPLEMIEKMAANEFVQLEADEESGDISIKVSAATPAMAERIILPTGAGKVTLT